jgi:hypothetical protein
MDPIQLVICTFYNEAPVCVEKRAIAEEAKRRHSPSLPVSPASPAATTATKMSVISQFDGPAIKLGDGR